MNIDISLEKVGDFCQRWNVLELSLFGSALRGDFHAESDVDMLVTFGPTAEWSLFDHMTMEEELSGMLGRKVDLVTRRSVERSANWIRRKSILNTAVPLYVTR